MHSTAPARTIQSCCFRIGHSHRFDPVVTDAAFPIVPPQRARYHPEIERHSGAPRIIRAGVVSARDPVETQPFPCPQIHRPEVSLSRRRLDMQRVAPCGRATQKRGVLCMSNQQALAVGRLLHHLPRPWRELVHNRRCFNCTQLDLPNTSVIGIQKFISELSCRSYLHNHTTIRLNETKGMA